MLSLQKGTNTNFMKKIFLFFFLINLSPKIYGATSIGLSMVPHGKLVETLGRDLIIKTQAGTKIQIEFRRDGKFKEAKGLNLNKGDELEPGEGLLSLSSVAQILQRLGKKPQGIWTLENDEVLGWIYEVNNSLISAKSGKILK